MVYLKNLKRDIAGLGNIKYELFILRGIAEFEKSE
jgi:hypothetical protein